MVVDRAKDRVFLGRLYGIVGGPIESIGRGHGTEPRALNRYLTVVKS